MSKVESILKVGFVLVSYTEVILSLFQVFNKWQKVGNFYVATGYYLDIFYDSEAMVLSVGTEAQIRYNKRKNITKQ